MLGGGGGWVFRNGQLGSMSVIWHQVFVEHDPVKSKACNSKPDTISNIFYYRIKSGIFGIYSYIESQS